MCGFATMAACIGALPPRSLTIWRSLATAPSRARTTLLLSDKDFLTQAGHAIFREVGLPIPLTAWVNLYMNKINEWMANPSASNECPRAARETKTGCPKDSNPLQTPRSGFILVPRFCEGRHGGFRAQPGERRNQHINRGRTLLK
jgi:hypothetical protein